MSHMELHFAVRVHHAFRDIALGSRGAPQDGGSNEP